MGTEEKQDDKTMGVVLFRSPAWCEATFLSRVVGNDHFCDTTERASQRLFCSYKGAFPCITEVGRKKPLDPTTLFLEFKCVPKMRQPHPQADGLTGADHGTYLLLCRAGGWEGGGKGGATFGLRLWSFTWDSLFLENACSQSFISQLLQWLPCPPKWGGFSK